MPLVAIVFGWPAIIVSIILSLTGIATGSWRLALAGAAVAVPFLLYMLALPRFGATVIPVAILYFAAAWAVARGRQGMAFALTTPFVALSLLMARLVLGQFAR